MDPLRGLRKALVSEPKGAEFRVHSKFKLSLPDLLVC